MFAHFPRSVAVTSVQLQRSSCDDDESTQRDTAEGAALTPGSDVTARDALTTLMDLYETPLFRFVFVMLADRDAASDCTQDAFVRAYEYLRQGRTVNRQWLYTVARNRAIDELRRRKRESADLETLEVLPALQGIGPEQSVAMRVAFAGLSADDRSVLYLVAVEGRSGAEIAELLGISRTAVRMRVSRARERFRLAYGAIG